MNELTTVNDTMATREEIVLRGIEDKDIATIEMEIKKYQGLALESRARAVICLQYLCNTGRFRENVFYKNASFERYLEMEFGIKEEAFRDTRYAIAHHYQDAEKYGVGTISIIKRTCGGLHRVGAVLTAIRKEEEKRKAPLTSDVVKRIIGEHKIPTPPPPAQPPVRDFEAIYKKAKESNQEAEAELVTLRDQVERQKGAIIRLRDINDKLSEENAALKQEIATLRRGSV